jgi:L-seryl-tRNA(Ser) seleniumtransferase
LSGESPSLNDLLRRLPPVEAVLSAPLLADALREWRRHVVLRFVREEIAGAREGLLRTETPSTVARPSLGASSSRAGTPAPLAASMETPIPDADVIARRVLARLAALEGGVLRPVVNATGVLLHTNLGRSVLSPQSQAAVARIAAGYSNLEVDLDTGRRTRRDETLQPLITALTGAEAATVVNNCAAAVYLALFTIARGKEVVTSRGELVEIGGSYRVPEVVKASGCKLVEVGATNKTRLADYEAAITPKTALLLKTHTSNYRIRGFTEEASVEELAALGAKNGIPVLVDLGSGLVLSDESTQTSGATVPGGHPPDAPRDGRSTGASLSFDEPDVLSTLAAGPDLVCFSGDKLLGGPQAGILLGKRVVIERLRKNQMWRALRIGKLTAGALGATLLNHLRGVQPHWRQRAELGADALRAEAEALRETLRAAVPQWRFEVIAAPGSFGGGSLPDETVPSFAVSIEAPGLSADKLDAKLRRGEPAVSGYGIAGRYALNVLALLPGDHERIADALRGAGGG